LSTDLREELLGWRQLSIFEEDKTVGRPKATDFGRRSKNFLILQTFSSIPAICTPPGARLLVQDILAKLQRECGFQAEVEEAVFTQVTAVVNTFPMPSDFKTGLKFCCSD
jgi:hypothetical protein